VHDSDYWLRITRQALRGQIPCESRITDRPLVTEMRRFRALPELRGWFMNEEIDDINWHRAGNHLRFALLPAASERLSRLRSRSPVAISASPTPTATPAQLEVSGESC